MSDLKVPGVPGIGKHEPGGLTVPGSAALAAPTNTVAPAITGSPNVGSTLSCSQGNWIANPAPTYTYQWIYADTSANISGATSSTYTLVSGDLGHTIKCTVTATNSQGSASATSNTTAAVTNAAVAPSNSVAPSVTGTPQVGSTLSCSQGTWSGSPTPTYAYQWFYADTSTLISGATSTTYAPITSDIGHTIKCRVTATNIAGSVFADSNTTLAVVAAGSYTPSLDFSDSRNTEYTLMGW